MNLLKINPFYKCVCVMIISIALSTTYSIILNLSIFLISMILILVGTKRIGTALKFILFTTLPAFGYFVTGLYFSNGQESSAGTVIVSSVQDGLNLGTRMYAFVGLGMVFSLSTNTYDFVKSLQKDAKLPRKFAYGVLCAFNLMPYIKNEFLNARLALQVRGVRVGLFSIKPLFSALVNCIRWSEVLSMAMQSKGFYEE